MSFMFYYSKFNKNIATWDISKVLDMSFMFTHSKFNQDLTLWYPNSLLYTAQMFESCPAPIPYWAEYEELNERKKALRKCYRILKDKEQLEKTLDLSHIGAPLHKL